MLTGKRKHPWGLSFRMSFISSIGFVALMPCVVRCFSPTRGTGVTATMVLDASIGSTSEREGSTTFLLEHSRVKESAMGPPVKKSPRAAVLAQSTMQRKSCQSSSPAVLLTSGPGTGKTYTLASRVAYLLKEKSCPPDRMVIMSFSNRDAEVLKSKALDQVYHSSESSFPLTRKQLGDRLWSGTLHKFAGNVIGAYSPSKKRVRVISDRDAKLRIDRCLRQLLDQNRYKDQGNHEMQKLAKFRVLHRDALVEVQQSRDVMIHQIARCVELWKEASILPPPSVHGIVVNLHSYSKSRQETRDNCLELATRLGVTQNVAFLAWTIFPMYQELHQVHETADPADLAPLAFHLLLSHPDQLKRLRHKLKHVIVDEYQDISVSQHSLIRLVIRGIVDEMKCVEDFSKLRNSTSLPPILRKGQQAKSLTRSDSPLFDVPRLFCAGDVQQSIYGFRGAAPELSVEGFRKDFPQGVTASLDTSFRLAERMWSTVNSLFQDGEKSANVETYRKSPAGVMKARETLYEAKNGTTTSHEAESLADLLSDDLEDDMIEDVHVQGVWDAREEAKYIANQIKRRTRERTKHLADAVQSASTNYRMPNITDPSEVAIIVRASNQLSLIREALVNAGIPFTDLDGETNLPVTGQCSSPVKPVVIMTMHGSKGEEFDDVYLPGWTEGVFPHPSAVSSNRVDEERRLAYVAISRARQRVLITHSFVRRALHIGTNILNRKRVTMQVRPSRFLYELVPNGVHTMEDFVNNTEVIHHSELDSHLPSVTWDRSRGSKGGIAGSNLPEYFRKSYETPRGLSAPEHPDQELLIMERQLQLIQSTRRPNVQLSPLVATDRKRQSRTKSRPKVIANPNTPIMLTPTNISGNEIDTVLFGLNEILAGNYGSSTKHKQIFKRMLKDNFGFGRGKFTLFSFEDSARNLPEISESIFENFLEDSPTESLSTRPLSQGTGFQLGLFLLWSLRQAS